MILFAVKWDWPLGVGLAGGGGLLSLLNGTGCFCCSSIRVTGLCFSGVCLGLSDMNQVADLQLSDFSFEQVPQRTN
jgi:hypothetical protein